jgi:hypothetical protein
MAPHGTYSISENKSNCRLSPLVPAGVEDVGQSMTVRCAFRLRRRTDSQSCFVIFGEYKCFKQTSRKENEFDKSCECRCGALLVQVFESV